MKILAVPQIREADAITMKNGPLSSLELMERAATACVSWITVRFDTAFEFSIICGTGNNGGDGLAIARLLAERNYKVHVLIAAFLSGHSADFTENYKRLKEKANTNCRISEVDTAEAFAAAFIPHRQTLVIDAMFGSGLNRPVEGVAAEVIQQLNRSLCKVIAIDIPSGLYADKLNDATDVIVQAAFTLSFQFPKLSFMFPETAALVGEFAILDIRLDTDYINTAPCAANFVTASDAAALLKKRAKNAHKGNFGHSLIVAGSYGKMGAAVLAARACLRSGTGLLTVYVPQCGYEILQSSIPEAMVSTGTNMNYLSGGILPGKYNAIGIGPGIGMETETQDVIKSLLGAIHGPLVIDADAINILSANTSWLASVPSGSIFTPHPKEFERLAGKAANSEERLKLQREFSERHAVYVILKGAHTCISCPGGSLFFNSTGNPGMAKGGSGDVLTGIITSLLAQHYAPEQACILGVYLHGLAGDLALTGTSVEGMLASDLVEHIPAAFNVLRNGERM